MRRFLAIPGAVLLAGIYGCGGKSPGGNGGAAGADLDASDPDALVGAVACAPATYPIDTYAPDMVKVGENNLITFHLVKSEYRDDVAMRTYEGPPQLGNNTWTLKFAENNGQMPSGDILGHASMPLHSHPAMAQPVVTLDGASGTYKAAPVYLFMVGYWKVEFTVYDGPLGASSTPVDVAAFNFCID